jgi:hypothetical protein
MRYQLHVILYIVTENSSIHSHATVVFKLQLLCDEDTRLYLCKQLCMYVGAVITGNQALHFLLVNH